MSLPLTPLTPLTPRHDAHAHATSVWPCDATAISAVTPLWLGELTVRQVILSHALTWKVEFVFLARCTGWSQGHGRRGETARRVCSRRDTVPTSRRPPSGVGASVTIRARVRAQGQGRKRARGEGRGARGEGRGLSIVEVDMALSAAALATRSHAS